MRFIVLPIDSRVSLTPGTAVLYADDWDDWFKHSTLYKLLLRDSAGVEHQIGGVKIGEFGMEAGQRRPNIPGEFELLDDRFFSLGQDDSYYEALHALGAALRDEILTALRDVAADLDLFDRALREDVTRSSLLRSVSAKTVRHQFHPRAHGNAELTPFHFMFRPGARPSTDEMSGDAHVPPLALSFDVEPDSRPPTNIHVLIGRNGVGKTHLLRQITRTLLDVPGDDPAALGEFASEDGDVPEDLFANLVSVSFSAFDPFVPYDDRRRPNTTLRYAYVGLGRAPAEIDQVVLEGGAGSEPPSPGSGRGRAARQRRRPPKHDDDLAREFGRSMRACSKLGKLARWRRAVETLESDPRFRAADIVGLGREDHTSDDRALRVRARKLFHRLSSGHKIVLLTVTRLVELVDERTLVLLDEPEAHLHPPLLAAFVRALSRLLIERNGVAIVATHSPVLLQEVPADCVWLLRRTGTVSYAERPELQTFGENVGVLTREVFGLEVADSGFHRMIRDAVDRGLSFEQVTRHFHERLGAEARSLARALVLERDRGRAGAAAGRE